jgi:hypothetical protein
VRGEIKRKLVTFTGCTPFVAASGCLTLYKRDVEEDYSNAEDNPWQSLDLGSSGALGRYQVISTTGALNRTMVVDTYRVETFFGPIRNQIPVLSNHRMK